MREIVHISDLHFGTQDPRITTALCADLDGRTGAVPALVAVSGDLTQRARTAEFRAAKQFLDALPAPYLVTPGNHDVPLYDVAARFLHPYRKFERELTADLQPSFVDDELAAVAINTAHGATMKGGRIRAAQVAAACQRFAAAPGRAKLVIAHHPFVVPRGVDDSDRVVGADAALTALAAAGVELVLTGHLHVAYTSDEGGFRSDDQQIVAVHAGTCISSRTRGEANGYNRLIIDGDALTIIHKRWDGARFADVVTKRYQKDGGRWRRLAVEVSA